MTDHHDGIVHAVRAAGVMEMALEERTNWIFAELGRRFQPAHLSKTASLLDSADRLIRMLGLRDLVQRIERLERRVEARETPR